MSELEYPLCEVCGKPNPCEVAPGDGGCECIDPDFLWDDLEEPQLSALREMESTIAQQAERIEALTALLKKDERIAELEAALKRILQSRMAHAPMSMVYELVKIEALYAAMRVMNGERHE